MAVLDKIKGVGRTEQLVEGLVNNQLTRASDYNKAVDVILDHETRITDIEDGSFDIAAFTADTINESTSNTGVTVEGVLIEDSTITTSPTTNAVGSFQAVAADLNLGVNAGTSDGGDTDFLAPVMGNVLGTNLTKTNNYIGGVIGHYTVDGTNASTMPVGAVLAGIGDLTTTANGAVVAYIDGDSGITTADAAFKVMHNNSTPGSGFNYGVNLSHGTHNGFNAVAYNVGELRTSNGQVLFTGTATTRGTLRTEVNAKIAHAEVAIGSAYFSSAGKIYLKVADADADTDWERVTTSAAD